jgi:hypothetical protein
MNRLPLLAAALPAVLVGLVSVAQVGLSLFAANPVWAVQPVTMAEAAALRDPGTVMRRIRQGADSHTAQAVREGIVSNEPVMLTPLDAAIAARRGEVIELLVWAAPPRHGGEWVQALCLAAALGDEGISEILARLKPPSVEPDCAGFTRPW